MTTREEEEAATERHILVECSEKQLAHPVWLAHINGHVNNVFPNQWMSACVRTLICVSVCVCVCVLCVCGGMCLCGGEQESEGDSCSMYKSYIKLLHLNTKARNKRCYTDITVSAITQKVNMPTSFRNNQHLSSVDKPSRSFSNRLWLNGNIPSGHS